MRLTAIKQHVGLGLDLVGLVRDPAITVALLQKVYLKATKQNCS